MRTTTLKAWMAVTALCLAAACQSAGSRTSESDFSALNASESGAGFSAEGLAALEAAMKARVDKGTVKGISTLLVKDGQVIQYTDYGLAQETGAVPMKEDTIFRIYSMSKPITGAALMTLYDQGMFSLNDPVTKFIPEFADLKVHKGTDAKGAMILEPMTRPPTMREIMSHTAGFAYGLSGDTPVDKLYRDGRVLGSPDLDAYIKKLSGIPLLDQPGTRWNYSTVVDIQGYIIQKISGKPLSDYMREAIFEPLGMVDTGFYVPAEKYDRFADVFAPDPKVGGLVRMTEPSFAFKKEMVAMEAGGHGLVSTMADYARFAEMMAGDGALGRVRILKPETARLMHTNVLAPTMRLFDDRPESFRPIMDGQGFGLDFAVVNETSKAGYAVPKGSYYWGGAAGTWFWIDPQNDLFFIGMIQLFGSNGIDWDMRRESSQLVYAALEE